MKPFPGTLTRRFDIDGGPYVLDDEQTAWLKKWFPITENRLLGEAMGIGQTSLHRIARTLKLKKSKSGLAAILKRQAKLSMKINTESGYYASLKGRRVSDACLEAYQRYLHSDRYEHPIKMIKRKDPERYAAIMKERGEARRELCKKEKLRVAYGLKKRTKLKTVTQAYTRQQVCQRYNAGKYGYLLSEDTTDEGGERYIIFYDEFTNRSEVFEKNSKKVGFRFEHA